MSKTQKIVSKKKKLLIVKMDGTAGTITIILSYFHQNIQFLLFDTSNSVGYLTEIFTGHTVF
jgi:hypothetical protein